MASNFPNGKRNQTASFLSQENEAKEEREGEAMMTRRGRKGEVRKDEEEEKPAKPVKKAAKKAKAAPKKELSPVRGPAGRGRGNATPAWMQLGIGNTSAPEPTAPAGRGRGNATPAWMKHGVTDEAKPHIPTPEEVEAEELEANSAPHILDSIFEERDVDDAMASRRGGRNRSLW